MACRHFQQENHSLKNQNLPLPLSRNSHPVTYRKLNLWILKLDRLYPKDFGMEY